jgi:hypothetical protein
MRRYQNPHQLMNNPLPAASPNDMRVRRILFARPEHRHEAETRQRFFIVKWFAVSRAADMKGQSPIIAGIFGSMDTRFVDVSRLSRWCRETVFGYELSSQIRFFPIVSENLELISAHCSDCPRRMFVRTRRPSWRPVSESEPYSKARHREKRNQPGRKPTTLDTTEFPRYAVDQKLIVCHGGCHSGLCADDGDPLRVRPCVASGKRQCLKYLA